MKKANLQTIVFSGGEPLLRPDVFELIEYACSLDIMSLMGSNGILITTEVAKNLKSSGLSAIAISIDSLNREVHDDFRGKEGSLEKAL